MRVLYLHGLGSGPSSHKAGFFRDRFARMGIGLEQPVLSVPSLREMTLSSQLSVVEELLPAGEKAVLIGSSMGGYVAALFSARFPERVARQVLLAPAFGFPARWFARLPEEEAEAWRSTGLRPVWDYENGREDAVGYALAEDGLRYEDFPEAKVPTLVLHGRQDDTVPAAYSEEYAAAQKAAKLVLFDSDHSLGDVFEPMWAEVAAFFSGG